VGNNPKRSKNEILEWNLNEEADPAAMEGMLSAQDVQSMIAAALEEQESRFQDLLDEALNTNSDMQMVPEAELQGLVEEDMESVKRAVTDMLLPRLTAIDSRIDHLEMHAERMVKEEELQGLVQGLLEEALQSQDGDDSVQFTDMENDGYDAEADAGVGDQSWDTEMEKEVVKCGGDTGVWTQCWEGDNWIE
jgi:hypothetical protein